MYDIKIFLEDNGSFGACAKIGKESIYALGNTNQELLNDLRKGIECALSHRDSIGQKSSRMVKFLELNTDQYATKV